MDTADAIKAILENQKKLELAIRDLYARQQNLAKDLNTVKTKQQQEKTRVDMELKNVTVNIQRNVENMRRISNLVSALEDQLSYTQSMLSFLKNRTG